MPSFLLCVRTLHRVLTAEPLMSTYSITAYSTSVLYYIRPSDCILPFASPAFMEPVTGTEPAYSAWKADVLPLNYTGMPRPVKGGFE